jgi:hypothetical protein
MRVAASVAPAAAVTIQRRRAGATTNNRPTARGGDTRAGLEWAAVVSGTLAPPTQRYTGAAIFFRPIVLPPLTLRY